MLNIGSVFIKTTHEKGKGYCFINNIPIKATSISILIILLLMLTAACGKKVENNEINNANISDNSNKSVEVSENDKIEKAMEAFINDFNLEKDYTEKPVICDINNDDENEAIFYNTKYKQEDFGYSKILAAYSLGSRTKIAQLVGSPDFRFEVKSIKNPKYKNCIAIATGADGFFIKFYRLDGDKFIKFDAFEGEEAWKLVDVDGDGYHEILTLAYNINSQSSEDKFIAVTFKWNGSKYIKFSESNDTDINWDEESNAPQVQHSESSSDFPDQKNSVLGVWVMKYNGIPMDFYEFKDNGVCTVYYSDGLVLNYKYNIDDAQKLTLKSIDPDFLDITYEVEIKNENNMVFKVEQSTYSLEKTTKSYLEKKFGSMMSNYTFINDETTPVANTANTSNVFGNTSGNIVNRGLAAIQGDFIYYIDNDMRLCKLNIINNESTVLDGPYCKWVNVVGDYIYYQKWDNPLNELELFNKYCKLMRIKTDGTDKKVLDQDSIWSLHIKDDWIYYYKSYSYTGYSVDDPGIYKMKIDGSQKTLLLLEDTDSYIEDMVLYDNYIFYTDSFSKKGKKGIYKINNDGTGKVKLYDDSVISINVENGWVYFSNRGIYKVKIDGTCLTCLTDEYCNSLNVIGEWIIYSNGSDHSKLYAMKTDGSNIIKISDDMCENINVAGEWIFYKNLSQNHKYYRIKLDGTGRSVL